jgi:transposase InsO family protein/transposase-like protein
MPRAYASQFRSMVVEQVRSGRRVVEVAAAVGVPEATVYRWVKQERIDRGEVAGTSTGENADLRAARRRITELEAELATVKRATELFAEGRVVRPKALFAIVETLAREGHGTKRVCRLLRVAPSGFFRWRSKPPSDRAIRRAWLTDVIGQIHERSRRTYGHRRIRAELDDAYGQRVNKKLIQAIMRQLGIAGLPARRRAKPNLAHRATTADLVNRDFHRDGPNQLWMTDITEHPTREGKVYCCVVLDAWSRKIVGWSIDRRPTAAMVNAALGMAIDQRTPPRGALVHSDHGSQYTSWTFSQRVRSSGLAHSLGTVGDAFDNAMVESFWGRMQTELLNTRKWKTRIELSSAIFDWIEAFYNRVRRHSSLGMISPIAYEKLHDQHTNVA